MCMLWGSSGFSLDQASAVHERRFFSSHMPVSYCLLESLMHSQNDPYSYTSSMAFSSTDILIHLVLLINPLLPPLLLGDLLFLRLRLSKIFRLGLRERRCLGGLWLRVFAQTRHVVFWDEVFV
ncbi:hypothetical protein G7K_2155-t1 [Saitoella complicata NRRL Y-17804]|uniref:Uncharacterized protein n=1 Tax=Saitoella complicata (strain BCRC 22490 / CBS 7301 / JCM 7358 / NBRC 10748 / NRRL Y-17804) TaxID=698492 RepID=A0A0E9NE37_SAICN|nr:hypothetical protein G7K_2155-t1 [Saitoella complicata NRRL Y-17804]